MKNQCWRSGVNQSILKVLGLLMIISNSGHAGVYSFGSGCASLGSWTQQALQQTQAIKGIVEALKDDPNCAGIETIVPKIAIAEEVLKSPDSDATVADRLETIPNEIAALSNFMVASPELKSQVLTLMAARKIEAATLTAGSATGAAVATAVPGVAEAAVIAEGIKNLGERSQRSLRVGLDMLDQSLDILPNLDRCLLNKPNQGLAMMSASVKLAAAFASSSDGIGSRMANTVAKLVTFLRNKKFTTRLAELDESEFWMSVSCLMETTTQTYCTARDRHKLLDYSLRQLQPKKDESVTVDVNNPLAGYYVLTRDVPNVSSWIQKIQFGIEPKLQTDATFKNRVWGYVTELTLTINNLRGLYNETLLTYNSLPDVEARRTTVLKLIGNLSNMMADGESGGADGRGLNFFTQGVTGQMFPYLLIGLAEIPDEVVNSPNGMSWDDWMLNRGKWQPMFHAPDELISKIDVKLEELIKGAVDRASIYFQQRMIVDMSNLVVESVTNQASTVVQSFKRISSYLTGLEQKIAESGDEDSILLVPMIRETNARIGSVLVSYQTILEAILSGGKNPDGTFDPKKMDEEIKAAYQSVIETTYQQFNVLLQRDTFLPNRLSTFIHHDYAMRVKRNEDVSSYEKELMVEAGNELLYRLLSLTGNNPTQVKNDLETALVINKRNLHTVESLFKDSVKNIIGQLTFITEQRGAQIPTFGETYQQYKKQAISEKKNFFANSWGYIWAFSSSLGENATYLPWARSSIHSKTYQYKPKNEAAFESGDDEFGSFQQLKAKYCVQTLAFEDRKYFYDLCRGTILRAAFDKDETEEAAPRDEIPLDLAYSSYANPKTMGKPVNGDSICAFQSYGRRNLVYWLTRDLSIQSGN